MNAALHYDLIIIGAGPAGMSAAIYASKNDMTVLVLDDQPAGGGQVYRHVMQNAAAQNKAQFLGSDYWSGHKLADEFTRSSASLWPESRVWQITKEREVFFSQKGKAHRAQAGAILIATGAMERPMPITGWTLPGVMTIGAAQTMLKTSHSGVDGALFVGSGPLFYLTIWQYLNAGFDIKAVIDTAPGKMSLLHYFWALPALLQPSMLIKGLKWRSEIRHKTHYISGATAVSISGDSQAEALRFTDASGKQHRLEAEHIFLHQGVVPSINLTMATELEHRWCPRQLCWHPKTDIFGESSVQQIFVAGDGMGIAGAAAAISSGKIAAMRITAKARGTSSLNAVFQMVRQVQKMAIRPFLDYAFKPADEWLVPHDENAIICRCESLTKADITKAITLGVSGPNQLKSFSRAGMGRCQGRMCGLTIQKMITDHNSQSDDKTGYYRLRPPIRPLTVGELAALADDTPTL